MYTIYLLSINLEWKFFLKGMINFQRYLTRTNNEAKKFHLTRTKGRWRLFLWQRWLPERKGRSSSEDDEKWKEVHELGLNLVWWCFPWWYWWWCCQCKTFKERMTGTIPQRHLQSRTDAKYILLSGGKMRLCLSLCWSWSWTKLLETSKSKFGLRLSHPGENIRKSRVLFFWRQPPARHLYWVQLKNSRIWFWVFSIWYSRYWVCFVFWIQKEYSCI